MSSGHDVRVTGETVAGVIAAAFSAAQLGEVECRRFLASLIRPAVVCPGCGCETVARDVDRMIDGRDIKCKECGRKQSLFANTVLCGLALEARAVVLACVMRNWGCSLGEIAAATGAYPSTISRLMDRLSFPTRSIPSGLPASDMTRQPLASMSRA